MKRLLLLLALAVGASMAISAPAIADDLNIPPWWWEGGDPWSDPARTFQVWEFDVNPLPDPIPIPEPVPPFPIDPEPGSSNLNGLQPLMWDPGETEGWLPELGTPVPIEPYEPRLPGDDLIGTGVVALSGRLEIPVFNDPTPRPEKKVWIQLTWAPQDQMPFPEPIVGVMDIQPGDPSQYVVTPVQETNTIDLGGGWTHSTYEFSIYPNPDFEIFEITGDIYVDELIVDTHCVPEPATLSMLGVLAVMGLAIRRRKR